MNCEKIKQKISIRKVLESFNLFPAKENHRTAFYFAIDREEKIPSLSVDFIKNKAFDFGTGKSYDVISIVQQVNRCSVSEALKYLQNLDLSVFQQEDRVRVENSKNYEVLQVGEIRHPALLEYLKVRKVFNQRHLVKEISYRLKGKVYFGIGFQNDSKGFEIRNKYTKICIGKKDVTWIKNESSQNAQVLIFEGFFDYLTYRNIKDWQRPYSDHLVLNSTAMFFKVQEKLKEYNRIFLFLDNDANGKATTEMIQQAYESVSDRSFLYKDFNDLNDWICNSD